MKANVHITRLSINVTRVNKTNVNFIIVLIKPKLTNLASTDKKSYNGWHKINIKDRGRQYVSHKWKMSSVNPITNVPPLNEVRSSPLGLLINKPHWMDFLKENCIFTLFLVRFFSVLSFKFQIRLMLLACVFEVYET